MGYNLEQIQAIADGDQDFIITLVTTFVEEVSADLVTFKQEVAAEKFKDIYQVSHKIKPNLELLNMQESFNLNLKILNWAKEETNMSDIASNFPTLNTMISDDIEALKKEFNLS
ncbi:MAG: hypothetical protein AAF611_12485 [Bacteroidota bacterium]